MLRRLMIASAASNPAAGLEALEFSEVAAVPYLDYCPSLLRQFTDTFDSTNYTASTTSVAMSHSVSAGKLVVSASSSGDKNLFVREGVGILMPHQFVSVDVSGYIGPTNTYAVISAGIHRDANNWIMFAYDAHNKELRFESKIAGNSSFYGAITGVTLTAPYRLGFSVLNNRLVGWTDTGTGWVARQSYPFAARLDLMAADLSSWQPCLLFACGNSCSFTVDNFTAGRFGGNGIRDITTVTNEAGDAYIDNGKVYVSATTTDPLGNGYQGVFRVDLETWAIEQTGIIMIQRGGKTWNDLSGHIIRRSATDQLLTIATWGNGFSGAIDILGKEVATDLLHGSSLVSGMTKWALPYVDDSSDGTYDPFLIRAGDTWRLAYSFVENTSFAGDPFWPALAESTDLVAWSPVAQDSTHNRYEGTKFVRIAGGYQIVAGGRSDYRVYDQDLIYIDAINAPIFGGASTQPHPMIFDDGGRWIMLTFDDQKPVGVSANFTWGRMRVNIAPKLS